MTCRNAKKMFEMKLNQTTPAAKLQILKRKNSWLDKLKYQLIAKGDSYATPISLAKRLLGMPVSQGTSSWHLPQP